MYNYTKQLQWCSVIKEVLQVRVQMRDTGEHCTYRQSGMADALVKFLLGNLPVQSAQGHA